MMFSCLSRKFLALSSILYKRGVSDKKAQVRPYESLSGFGVASGVGLFGDDEVVNVGGLSGDACVVVTKSNAHDCVIEV